MNIYNSERYLDPTAYEAIKNIEQEIKRTNKSVNKITKGGTKDEGKGISKMFCR